MESYTQEFYQDRHQRTLYAANTVLSIVLNHLPAVNSAVDLGCGVGTWLSVLRGKGVKLVQGVDGGWVDKKLLQIPEECFLQADLSKPITLPNRFDLAVSLEVAEHLPHKNAESFVDSLTRLSDVVLFSAAIPFQGGRNHINEQWQDYWSELFLEKEYIAMDIVRKEIWNDVMIPFWYKQNTLLFVRKNRISDIRLRSGSAGDPFSSLSIIHPDLYLAKVQDPSVKDAYRLFKRAAKSWIKKRVKWAANKTA